MGEKKGKPVKIFRSEESIQFRQCQEWKRLFQGVREMISFKTFNSYRE